MGDLFGGESTTTTTYEPFSGVIKDRFNSFYDPLLGRVNNRQGYTGQFTAPMNDTQRQAISLIGNNANNQTFSHYANGKYIDPTQNQYVRNMADQIKSTAIDQMKTAGNAIDSRWNNRNFFDSSSHASALDRVATDINKNVADATNSLYNNAYQQGVGNMLNAQAAQQSANNALLNAGNAAYNIADTELQRRYQDYLATQGFNQQDIQNLLNYFSAGKNPSETKTTEEDGLGGVLGTLAGKGAAKLFKW